MQFQGVLNSLINWGNQKILVEKLNNVFGYIVFTAIALAISFLSVQDVTQKTIFIILFIVISLPISVACFINPLFGFFAALIYSSSIFLLERLFGDIPSSLGIDALIIITFLGILNKGKKLPRGVYFNPVNLVVVAWILYSVVQLFNPNLTTNVDFFQRIRGTLSFCITYYLIVTLTLERNFIRLFFIFWIVIASLASLYALYQEYFGLPWFDLKWVTSSKELIGLNFIGGRWRKWSFLSDCTAFGMFMASSIIASIVLLLGSIRFKMVPVFSFIIVTLTLAMIYSGTRTAYAMIPAGLSIYFILTFDNKKTVLFLITGVFFVVFLYFGPFYGPNISRLRSVVQPTEDASFDVREYNRSRIQPYIYSHPFGGGANTTGVVGKVLYPDHELAGFPPDSGYLKIALEYGWIGLALRFLMFATIMMTGTFSFLKVKDRKIRYYYLVIISVFFSLTIAYFAQVSVYQHPMSLIIFTIYALMNNLKYHDSTYISKFLILDHTRHNRD